MKTVAIITARGGSKGVPGKNLRCVGGVSLVARAIMAALETGRFDRVVVTTDSAEIAAEAVRYGAQPLARPEELAGDAARSIDAVLDALDQLMAVGERYDVCALLQPTSPLRTAENIVAALDALVRAGGGSVISVCACEHHPYKTLLLRGNELQPLHDNASMEAPRQSLPMAYRPNGAIYVNKVTDLYAFRRFFVQPLLPAVMDRAHSLDIDSEADLNEAELILQEIHHAS